jgi:hypothetical protein
MCLWPEAGLLAPGPTCRAFPALVAPVASCGWPHPVTVAGPRRSFTGLPFTTGPYPGEPYTTGTLDR